MGKTRDLIKKIRHTKGIFHAKMGTIKDRNSMDLTKEEDIKKMQQEELYRKTIQKRTEELYRKKKDLNLGPKNDPDDHDGVIPHAEPDILECKVKQASGAPIRTKPVEVMEFQLSFFKS